MAYIALVGGSTVARRFARRDRAIVAERAHIKRLRVINRCHASKWCWSNGMTGIAGIGCVRMASALAGGNRSIMALHTQSWRHLQVIDIYRAGKTQHR